MASVSGFALAAEMLVMREAATWCAKMAWTATNKKAPDDAGAFEPLI
jgi:hypothetical protein